MRYGKDIFEFKSTFGSALVVHSVIHGEYRQILEVVKSSIFVIVTDIYNESIYVMYTSPHSTDRNGSLSLENVELVEDASVHKYDTCLYSY